MADSTTEYGPVIIIKGPYKGQVGLYDDEGEGRKAIVYIWSKKSAYIEIPYSYFIPYSSDAVYENTFYAGMDKKHPNYEAVKQQLGHT